MGFYVADMGALIKQWTTITIELHAELLHHLQSVCLPDNSLIDENRIGLSWGYKVDTEEVANQISDL